MRWSTIPKIPAMWRANSIVFVSSFCVMVIELVASRILAPHIGVSLYTWTSIIGTILASIALGNYLGGRLADRFASPTVLAIILLAGSLTTIGILPAAKAVTSVAWFGRLPPMLSFTLITGCIFLLPAVILSMVSPLVIKLTLADLGKTGGVVGTIYAVSTAGSILGTYLTGFFFILWFGLRPIVWLVAGILVLTGVLAWFCWRVPERWKPLPRNLVLWILAFVLVLTALLIFQFRDKWQETYTRESNYYSIQVNDIGGSVKALALDLLIQAYVIPDQPTYLKYAYLNVFADMVQYINQDGQALKTLHLGGGGYSFPRYLEAVYPGSINEVVEIDPAVTEVAHKELGLPADTSIKTYNMDARQFLLHRQTPLKYDIVAGDVFNDFSTPYHLTTFEFDLSVKASLEQDGIYLVNIIDDYDNGRYLASFVRTLKQVFNNVYLFSTSPVWGGYGPSTYVMAATDRSIDLSDFRQFVNQDGVGRVSIYPHDEKKLDEYLVKRGALLLTDEHAPTDILLAKIKR